MQPGSEIGGTATISITDGAKFTADGTGGGAKWIYIGHLKQAVEAVLQPNPEGDVSPQFSVTIDGTDSVMNLRGHSRTSLGSPGAPGNGWVALAYFEGTSGQAAEINITDGGVLEMSGASLVSCAMGGEEETSATTKIKICGDGSKLLVKKGYIGYAGTSAGNSKVSLTTNIVIEDGGVLESDDGYLGYAQGTASSTTKVEVKDGGKLIVNGGTIGSKEDRSAANNTTTVVVSGKGELILEHGNIHGPANLNVGTNSAIILRDEACFRISNSVNMTATVDVYDAATISFEGVGSGASVYGTIWLHGGKLEHADETEAIREFDWDGPRIAIDTNADYEKDIDVGGLPASGLRSFSIQSDETSILNIGDGKLSLTNAKRQDRTVLLLIGDKRVRVQDSEKELTPIFQFANPESGQVAVKSGSRVILDFTGSHLTELTENGAHVTLEVQLTNGTLTGWKEGQNFEIGSNWGLHVTGVNAENGS